MGPIYTYIPSEVKLILSDYVLPDITNIGVQWSAEKFSMLRGIRGKHTRVRNDDTSCRITVSFLQTSISNEVFSQIVNLDGTTEGGATLLANLTISLKDLSGTTSFASDNAYIKNIAPISFTDGLADRTWVIECLSTHDVYVGSGYKPIANIFN